jgi:nucleoside-diphosphate-sugar epimerase
MDSALVIGGTRFVGRHLVDDLLAHDYAVTLFTRGNRENPFADRAAVDHVQGDRTDETDLRAAALTADYDAVFDVVAYRPADVATAVDLFADAEAYVYVSSGDAYGAETIPKREDETPLEQCTDDQAEDESDATYGNRKAEGDRVVFEAASRGVRAMSVRPCIVYGPHDYTERLDYWLERVETADRVVVPGDGTNLWHRAYVEDVASALRIVAERGDAGEAYNVGDRRLLTLEETVRLAAEAMGESVDVVHACDRELDAVGLSMDEFVLFREYPHVLATDKLASLGWESTPVETAMERTVADYRASDRDGSAHDPGREAEERLLGILDTL